jgi:FAD/FMN-containing dehydrogenase
VNVVDTIEDLADFLRTSDEVNVACIGSKTSFRITTEEQRVDPIVIGFEGILDFSPADQVLTVRAGTHIPALLEELETSGQTLALPRGKPYWPHLCGFPGSIGGTISMNLPHVLGAQCGSWRDWVLAMTVVLADGTIARSGSKVVKNVAGYDAHKLFVGSRGTLGVIAEVTLRTFPIEALPSPTVEIRNEWNGGPEWIQRTLRSDFAEAVESHRGTLLAVDWASSTMWCEMEPEDVGKKFTNDWFVRSGHTCGDAYWPNETPSAFIKRAKSIFDPTNKLNPGELNVA